VTGTQTIYGVHAVRSMLERHPERVLSLRLAERREDPRVQALAELARQHRLPMQWTDAHALKKLLGDVAHQGVAADITPLPPWTDSELLAALERTTAPLLLALDGVQDPHNLGACLRTADACGALAVIVPRDRAASLTPAARKVAAGAAETTPLVTVTNLARALQLLKQSGLWIVGADPAAPTAAAALDLKGPLALVLGAEGSGLRRLTRQSCDFLARLPRLGAVESLNVSVAAGMLLYEAVRQRGSGREQHEGGPG
jgi:23S rRNA (guanosine2251-2'-O)-methyltransferase